MQTFRVNTKLPLRTIRGSPATTRSMAFYVPLNRVSHYSHSFFPSVQQGFAPLLRFFDEFEQIGRPSLRAYQPRFDVREEKEAFRLQGELPGIEQQNISVEFVDPTTLVIRGRAVNERQTEPPSFSVGAAAVDLKTETSESQNNSVHTSTSESEVNSNYQHPSVEEEPDESDTSSANPSTPATTVPGPAENEQESHLTQQSKFNPDENVPHYWVSERSVGEFHRSFNFPGQIDQDAVSANLKNGILSIVVPKQQPKQPKRIIVQ